MKQTMLLLGKFLSLCVAFSIGLDLFFPATFVEVVSFSLAAATISYIIGDRILLPRIGNRNALVVDFFLVYLSVWLFGSTLLNSYYQIAWGSVLSAAIATAAEVLLHNYMLRSHHDEITTDRSKAKLNPKPAYGMEAAEEIDPRDHDN